MLVAILSLFVRNNMRKNWTAIAAMAENRVIGKGNKLPWSIPAEMAWFHRATSGGTLVVGRKTFESLPSLRPENKYIVVTRQLGYDCKADNAVTVLSLDDVPSKGEGNTPIWICGGEEIYRQALLFCDQVLLTIVKGKYEGDAFFPAFEGDFDCAEQVMKSDEFVIYRYLRK